MTRTIGCSCWWGTRMNVMSTQLTEVLNRRISILRYHQSLFNRNDYYCNSILSALNLWRYAPGTQRLAELLTLGFLLSRNHSQAKRIIPRSGQWPSWKRKLIMNWRNFTP
ncbi:hypothetical protein FVEG_16237 [Fusarium verticillioides 7600]|uniref:Uncharacterized protein n=1 Tax=Gibberella moniliformis (strain M3125 / FGSC 7600) TaxID=334819 RepID=W7M952_GIBM7|nr:hypothetical protein FVEG_16237 [Fusarium verticillioides 7600]XP_018754330.1 hypothetical protein FVEG_16237 [Fusarium verticillioides 7600]EWG48138.1 hypothetical protein FVEG_16237 [Fusarium verticillioides 7600]EWG48139.1 hypothetical protein FVEG_16237 [Fusarium verticillioides 7600]